MSSCDHQDVFSVMGWQKKVYSALNGNLDCWCQQKCYRDWDRYLMLNIDDKNMFRLYFWVRNAGRLERSMGTCVSTDDWFLYSGMTGHDPTFVISLRHN